MDGRMQPPRTIFDFTLDELRERAQLAKRTIGEMRDLLARVMHEHAGGAGAASAGDDALPSWDEVMKLLHEGLDLVTTLLPGLSSVTPEALIEAMQKAEDTAERGEEIRGVREALAGLVADLQKAHDADYPSRPPGSESN
jgi:hypothetical protein